LGQAFEILLNRLAEMSGKLAADLLQDFLTLLGRQVSPAVLLADVFWIDLPFASRPPRWLTVLGGIVGLVPLGLAGLLLLLLLLLFFLLFDQLFQLGDNGFLFVPNL